MEEEVGELKKSSVFRKRTDAGSLDLAQPLFGAVFGASEALGLCRGCSFPATSTWELGVGGAYPDRGWIFTNNNFVFSPNLPRIRSSTSFVICDFFDF